MAVYRDNRKVTFCDLAGPEMEQAQTEFRNHMASQGYGAWRISCAETIRPERSCDFDEERQKNIIKWSERLHKIGCLNKIGLEVIFTSIDAVLVCGTLDKIVISDTVDWIGAAQKINTTVPDNLKIDVLYEILSAVREGIRCTDRDILTSTCPAAVIIDDSGVILQLEMSIVENGQGWLYPDPYAALLTNPGEKGRRFIQSLENVASACGLKRWSPEPEYDQNDIAALKRDFDVRWSLLNFGGGYFYHEHGIGGPSLGGAMYTLCRALMMDAGKWLPAETKEAQVAEEA